MVQVNHLSFSSDKGGAAIAAHRLHDACLKGGLQSRMTVADGTVDPENSVDLYRARRTLRRVGQRELARHLRKKGKVQVDGLASLALAASGLAQILNGQPRQVLNLHWINSDLISIREIGRLKHPVVWTLHDMWPFCGAEHYTEASRWQSGYPPGGDIEGFDLNRWVWRRKQRNWNRPFHIVTPSNWLADCVRSSALMREWPVQVIPNAIDTDLWAPMPQGEARAALGLPGDVPVIAFGAMGGDSDPRKGFSYLREALLKLHDAGRSAQLLIFGAETHDVDLPFPVHFTGSLSDPQELRRVYACADVFALPSRQDNLPNTGVEALSCGTPIAGFDIGGLPDLVPDASCGHLAPPFDVSDLARGLMRVIDHQAEYRDGLSSPMRQSARQHALDSYAAPCVAKQYGELYRRVWSDEA